MSDQAGLWDKPTEKGVCPYCGQDMPGMTEEEREEARQEELERIRRVTPGRVRAILQATNRMKVRADDPPSSKISAFELLPRQPIIREKLLWQAVQYDRQGRRYCSDHLGRALGMDPDQFSSQVSDLKAAGLLRETDVMLQSTRGNPCMELELAVRIEP